MSKSKSYVKKGESRKKIQIQHYCKACGTPIKREGFCRECRVELAAKGVLR